MRALLDAGATPESVGIVARELRGVASALRRHLDRLAIPFSGVGATVPGGAVWRKARLLSATLRGGPELPAELWLEAAAGGPVTELLLALRTLGVSRLDEVAGLAAVAGGVPLPLPVLNEDGEPQPARVVAPRRIEELRERALTLVRISRAGRRGPPAGPTATARPRSSPRSGGARTTPRPAPRCTRPNAWRPSCRSPSG